MTRLIWQYLSATNFTQVREVCLDSLYYWPFGKYLQNVLQMTVLSLEIDLHMMSKVIYNL